MNRFLLAGLAGSLALSACDSNDPEPVAIEATLVSDVPADPSVERDPNTGQTLPGTYSLYDLDAGELVLSSEDTGDRAADSTGTAWDIGFNGTTVIFNGGTSGPGSVTAQLLTSTLFSELTEAPADGYLADGGNTSCPEIQTPNGPAPGSTLAVCTGSDNGWYNYNGAQNLISPLAGRVLVLKTSESSYAKLRFLSYYRGNPAAPNGQTDEGRYISFEYVLQPDGSRSFETTDA